MGTTAFLMSIPTSLNLPPLPICAILDEIRFHLAKGSAVLAAPPGSGKTTVVPLALLEEPWLAGKSILILEPRRLATRAAAMRMAAILGEPVGQRVGYQIRFDRKISKHTRIEVVTEGILTRRLQQDAALEDVGLVIFDEFHERSLHADLALALCLDLCQLREDLRLLVMSATLDTEPIARLLGGAPVITAKGKMFAVTTEYIERPTRGPLAEVVCSAVSRLADLGGDMLVFLPGSREIRDTHQLLQEQPGLADRLILPLMSELSQKDQDRAILPDPQGRRRIILATAIAETSLTIEGVRTVVDSGWSRLPAFDPRSGLTRLQTVRVSKATADQRTGRAGRLGPGHCLRLWTREEQHSLPAFHPAEIINADLAPLALELALWGVSEPNVLLWLDPPRAGSFAQACALLRGLRAVDSRGRITPMGRKMAELPLHPRLAHMLLQGRSNGLEPLACDLAALLSERDPLRGRERGCDVRDRLHLLATWRKKGDRAVDQRGGDVAPLRRIDQTAAQLRHTPNQTGGWQPEDVGALLLAAYPERVARRRPRQRDRYLLACGRGVRLSATDPLCGEEYLIAAQVDSGHSEGRIFLAAPVELATVQSQAPHLLAREDLVCWDGENARVTAATRTTLGTIVVEERPLADVPQERITAALLDGIAQAGLEVLPWNGKVRQLQARLLNLRQWLPEEDWPDVSDQALAADYSWLMPYLGTMNRLEQLKGIDLCAVLLSRISWPEQQRLGSLAPESISVPSGSKIRIEYRIDEPPLLAVRLQEMFGLQQTPAVCNGRVPLLLHLLSPARRPIQVTTDLASFWHNGYPQVKKELKGRYPKHAWPDDPLEAAPLRGVPRRR
nr:ATP-dependent helicase HrpB [uncultured Desulfobulbus sp.]